jgi:hypothetical protein
MVDMQELATIVLPFREGLPVWVGSIIIDSIFEWLMNVKHFPTLFPW